MGKVFQNLIFLTFIIFICISFASALKTFTQNEPAELCHAVRQGDGLPSNTNCNVTVSYSNGTILIDFDRMRSADDRYCYDLNSTQNTVKGLYDYEVTCTDGTENDTLSSQYLINLGGVEPSQSRTDTVSRTIWIFFGLGLLTFISMFFIKKTPIKLTLFLLMIWFMLMGINASYISIQDEVINQNIENFFSFFLTISFYANYFIFLAIIILWMVTFFVTFLDRKKKSKTKDYGTW